MRIFVVAGFLLVFPYLAYAGDQPGGPCNRGGPCAVFDDSVVSITEQSPAEVEEYWTPERMRNAQPMPMPSIDGPPVEMPPPGETPVCDVDECFGYKSDGGAYLDGGAYSGVVEGEAGAPPGDW